MPLLFEAVAWAELESQLAVVVVVADIVGIADTAVVVVVDVAVAVVAGFVRFLSKSRLAELF